MAFLPMALSMAGSIFGGVAALGQAKYQAQVAKRNAEIATRNGEMAAQTAQIESMRNDREMAALTGTQLAMQGASGLDVLGASQVATRALTRRSRDESAIDIRRKGEADTASYFNQAAGFKGEANAAKSAGIAKMIGGVLDAAGTLAGGSGSGGSLIGGPKSKKAMFG